MSGAQFTVVLSVHYLNRIIRGRVEKGKRERGGDVGRLSIVDI